MLSRLAAVVAALCREANVSLSQYRVLLYLIEQPMRPGELARLLAVSRPTATGMIRALEQRQWVRRESLDEDRRGVRVRVTARGRQAVSAVDERLQQLLRGLGKDAGLPALLSTLEALREPIDQAAAGVRKRLMPNNEER